MEGGGRTSEGDIVVVLEPVDSIDLATNVELLCGLVEIFDSWVLWVAAEDLLGLYCPGVVLADAHDCQSAGNLLVGLVDVVNGEDGQVAVVTEIAKGNSSTGLEAEIGDQFFGGVEGDGHGEEVAIGEAVVCDDSVLSISRLPWSPHRGIGVAYPL